METLIQLVAIGVRIAAIFVFLSGMTSLISSSYLLRQINEPLMYLWWIVIILPFVVALVMWKYPLHIARGIVPKVEKEEPIKDLSMNQIIIATLTIVGIGIMAITFPDLFYWVTHLLNAHYFSNSPIKELFPGPSFESLFSTIIELVFGIWLTLGSEGILNTINRLRFARPSS